MPNDPSEAFLRQLIDGAPSLGIMAEAPAQHRRRVATVLMMEQESAHEVGMLGYQARLLVQCSLPYRTVFDGGGSGVRFAVWAVSPIDSDVGRARGCAKAESAH